MIYFIQVGLRGPIKIGYSKNEEAVKTRLETLQIGSHKQLNLMAYGTGSRSDESKLHKKFEKFRINGEWFKPSMELNRFIKRYYKVIKKRNAQIKAKLEELNNKTLKEILEETTTAYITMAINTSSNYSEAAKKLGISEKELIKKFIKN